jgi:hypothetical protein
MSLPVDDSIRHDTRLHMLQNLKKARSAADVQRTIIAACPASAAVRAVDVIENLNNYLCILSFSPGGIDSTLVALLGATPYGLDCAMLVVPRSR